MSIIRIMGQTEEKVGFGSELPDWKHPMFSHSYN